MTDMNPFIFGKGGAGKVRIRYQSFMSHTCLFKLLERQNHVLSKLPLVNVL